MKTPDEIKKGLECCNKLECDACPYHGENDCSYLPCEDGLAYIRELESDLMAWGDVASSPGAVEDMARENARLMACIEHQKPLQEHEALGVDYCWLEVKGGNFTQPCDCVISSDLKAVIVRRIGTEFYFLRGSYGRTWRCWLVRPTDDERETAEWKV